jgi:NTP pyrophosphatase (non-canonical NTP hydrolase)
MQKAEDLNALKVKEELADIFLLALLLAKKYGFDVKEIVFTIDKSVFGRY